MNKRYSSDNHSQEHQCKPAEDTSHQKKTLEMAREVTSSSKFIESLKEHFQGFDPSGTSD